MTLPQPIRWLADPVWTLLAVLLVANALLLALTDFSLVLASEVPVLIAGSAVAMVAWIYSVPRPEPPLAGLACSGLQLLLLTNAIGLLSYLLTGLVHHPLLDGPLASLDAALGVDWLAQYRLIHSSPALHRAAEVLYYSLGPEAVALIVLLNLMKRFDRSRQFMLGFGLTAVTAAILGALMPALGAFVQFDLPETQTTAYIGVIRAVWDGSLRIIDLRAGQGLVVFPSFHAALATLCMVAVRRTGWLFGGALILNLLIVAVTPTIGGHYLVDIAAGIGIATAVSALIIVAARK